MASAAWTWKWNIVAITQMRQGFNGLNREAARLLILPVFQNLVGNMEDDSPTENVHSYWKTALEGVVVSTQTTPNNKVPLSIHANTYTLITPHLPKTIRTALSYMHAYTYEKLTTCTRSHICAHEQLHSHSHSHSHTHTHTHTHTIIHTHTHSRARACILFSTTISRPITAQRHIHYALQLKALHVFYIW